MNEEKREFMTAFNGSIDTLQRINTLIQHISIYRSNGHLQGFKENLGELFIECQGFLTKDELKKAKRDWTEINEMRLDITESGHVVYDKKLMQKMIDYSSWLRLKLHKHEVTMASKSDLKRGFDKLYQRYNL